MLRPVSSSSSADAAALQRREPMEPTEPRGCCKRTLDALLGAVSYVWDGLISLLRTLGRLVTCGHCFKNEPRPSDTSAPADAPTIVIDSMSGPSTAPSPQQRPLPPAQPPRAETSAAAPPAAEQQPPSEPTAPPAEAAASDAPPADEAPTRRVDHQTMSPEQARELGALIQEITTLLSTGICTRIPARERGDLITGLAQVCSELTKHFGKQPDLSINQQRRNPNVFLFTITIDGVDKKTISQKITELGKGELQCRISASNEHTAHIIIGLPAEVTPNAQS